VLPAPAFSISDARGRPLRDLRISVTDRCNFRCRYCMPREHFGKEHTFLPRSDLLTFEEIARLSHIAASIGVNKLRLTGGEPLLRADLPELVAMLAAIPHMDLALTTNGSLLARHAAALKRAGLRRLTVSLDALDPTAFRRMADTEHEVSDVLAGIQAAERAGFGPLKINTVVRRGVNEDEIVALARHFRGTGHVVRFIEYMDVGLTNGWKLDQVVSAKEILERLESEAPLEAIEENYGGEVARRFRYRDGSGEIGIIQSVTQPFCGACTRLRLSSEGKLYTCLFATIGHDLRAELRSGHRYSELRALPARPLRRIEMSYIGG
jgi:cyclic pyranopterin phosphate synthase